MPKTSQAKSAYDRQYYLDNPLTDERKAAISVYNKQYYLDNPRTDEQKVEHSVYKKQYRLDNLARYLKAVRLDKWKRRGVVCDDFDSLHDWYISQDICQICSVVLTTGGICSTRRVIDHCHTTGEVRGIICFGCNVRLPKQK